MTITHLLRVKHLDFNDEYFYQKGHCIKGQYATEQDAKQALLRHERAFWRSEHLARFELFYDAHQTTIDETDAFFLEKTGKALFEGFKPRHKALMELQDDDFIAFIDEYELNTAEIVPFNTTDKFYGIKLSGEDAPATSTDGYYITLCYAESQPLLIRQLWTVIPDEYFDHAIAHGQLADIVTDLSAFQERVKHYPQISYNAEQAQLTITFAERTNKNHDALFAVNALLSQPLFEVVTLSLDDVLNWEAAQPKKSWIAALED